MFSNLIVLGAIMAFLVFKTVLDRQKPLLEKIKLKYFAKCFYISAISFGLIHIPNYTLHGLLIFIYILYVTPQMVMGVFFGNIRMRYGFIWGFFLHAMVNITYVIPLLFKN